MKIVFMGTPDYAVKTLETLIKSEHTVAAVFAQPDKPVGRKQILTPPPVKVCAESYNIPVYQPNSVRTGEALEIINQINPDVIVVVAYGKILPKEILEAAKFGCVNGHASLLPKYRGSAPIQYAILCGETETGVTIQLMDEGIDTGDILETATTKIGDNETAEELFERLSVISADLMLSTINKLEKGEVTPKKQEGEATYAPIIKKEMALLDFNKPAKELFNAVRGYYSWPCAYFFMDGKRIKVIKAAVGGKTDKASGTVVGNSGVLSIACGDGYSLDILTLQAEGSKMMDAKQYLCGKQIPIGTVVGE
ncbi:MAG: methionyl-tRNA formyltransferase [Ruminococcaceae bacterium]|nr:methionyl-tRNA formyltransferase [Oscillospiraceae bacterium]